MNSFSACLSGHWCPPSVQFTPRLAQAYKSIISEVKNQFEIVFISSDRSQQEFDGYFAEMPWKALTYSERTRKDNLSRQFNVTGIPCLIILSPTCQVITKTGVQDIYSNGIENIRKWSAKAQQIIVASTEQIEPCLSGAGQVRITQYSREWTSSSGGQQAYISGSTEQHASSSSSSIEQRAQHALQQASSFGGGNSIEERMQHALQQGSSFGGGGGGVSIEYSTLLAQHQAGSSSSTGGSIERRTQHTIQQASSFGGGGSIEERMQHALQQASSFGGGGGGSSIEYGTVHAQRQASSSSSSTGGGTIQTTYSTYYKSS